MLFPTQRRLISLPLSVLMLFLGVVLALGGCASIPPAGPGAPTTEPTADPAALATHQAHMQDPALMATHQAQLQAPDAMATHEAQMQDPAVAATHQAQMQDPAAMATHEVLMHGTSTPAAEAQLGADTALTTFNTADFAGSGQCVMCHEGLVDAAGTDVSITTYWRSTMMASASRDPAWQAKVASEIARNPGLAALIEEKCASCHTPMAVAQAEINETPVALGGSGFLNPDNPLQAAAGDGVSCTLCHQIEPDNLGEKAGFSGGYGIDGGTEPPDRPAYGPYTDPFTRPMQMHTGFIPLHGEQVGSAALCGSCHNLFTPFVDAEGQVRGEFPEQTPYTEWEHSAFGAGNLVCQGCHMPPAGSGVVISTMPMRLGPREPFFRHEFVGGNVFMVEMLRDHAAELGVTAEAAQLEATAARAGQQLRRAASLTLEDATRQGDVLELRLRVNPATGHKFPTSFPSRRAWLHVTVTDALGAVIFESGKPEANGAIAGNDADADAGAFEPHYDRISAPDQVQIYEPIMADTDGRVTYTLLRAAKYLKDNRLLPAGADKAALPPEIGVYGEAANDANFAGGGDAVTYRVDLAGATGPFTVAAELLYQPLSHAFVQDMLQAGGAAADRFGGYYAAAGKAPDRVAAIEPLQVE
jgi:hypothetical protein